MAVNQLAITTYSTPKQNACFPDEKVACSTFKGIYWNASLVLEEKGAPTHRGKPSPMMEGGHSYTAFSKNHTTPEKVHHQFSAPLVFSYLFVAELTFLASCFFITSKLIHKGN